MTVPPSRPVSLTRLGVVEVVERLRLHKVRPSTVSTDIVNINQPTSSLAQQRHSHCNITNVTRWMVCRW